MKRTLAIVLISAAASIGLAVAPASAASCKLQPQADGNVYPVVCKGGKANAKAEPKLRKLAPHTMALKQNATAKQVKAAVCKDWKNSTDPILESVLLYQTTKYGWPKSYAAAFNDSVGTDAKPYC